MNILENGLDPSTYPRRDKLVDLDDPKVVKQTAQYVKECQKTVEKQRIQLEEKDTD